MAIPKKPRSHVEVHEVVEVVKRALVSAFDGRVLTRNIATQGLALVANDINHEHLRAVVEWKQEGKQ